MDRIQFCTIVPCLMVFLINISMILVCAYSWFTEAVFVNVSCLAVPIVSFPLCKQHVLYAEAVGGHLVKL